MSDDLQELPPRPHTVGGILRAAREREGISLEEVAAKTRIRINFLRALEEDNLEAMPGGVYAVGFIRNYCKVLGMDHREAINAYYAQTEAPGVRYMPDTRIPTGPGRPASARGAVILLVVLAVIVIAGNLLWRHYRSPGEPLEETTPPPAATAPPEETVVPPFGGPTPTPETPPGGLSLAATAEMNVNVHVVADGHPVFSGFMSPGDHQVWVGAQSVSLTADNAGALRVELNGEPLGQLGRVGERFQHEWRSSDTE